MKHTKQLLLALVIILAHSSSYAQDIFDNKAVELANKASSAYHNGSYSEAVTFINKCMDLYNHEALKQQEELNAMKYNASEEGIKSMFVSNKLANELNAVGTCLFIKGLIQEKSRNYQDALKTFRLIESNYSCAILLEAGCFSFNLGTLAGIWLDNIEVIKE